LAFIGLVVLLPFLLLIGLLIRMDSPGGSIYSQTRVGLNGRPFRMYKLRSMRPVKGIESGLTQGDGDPRITRVGHWIRRTKVDEVPQLWNVVRGDMSLVGPRPEVPQFVKHYTADQRRVLDSRPGLTDPASLTAFEEGEILSQVSDPDDHYLRVLMPQKVAAQIEYLEKRTLLSDAHLILRTLLRILRGR
jgi:lipopolysaccharide/colanic/teichoic acid biosynthesis glycosyltransferase